MKWHHDPTSSRDRRDEMVPDSPGALFHRLRSCEGFSFIEVMIVVVILAILATLLIPRVMGRTDDAKRAAAKAQISNIESALQLYKLDNGNIPTTEQGLKALVDRPVSGPAAPNWKAGRSLERSLQVHHSLHARWRVRNHLLRGRRGPWRRREKRRHRELGPRP